MFALPQKKESTMVSRLFFNITTVCVLLALGGSATWSQTPHAVGGQLSDVGKVEFENESITTVRIHMAPHEKTPMHDIVSPRLVIWLTDAHLKDTGSDGRVTDYSRPAGSMDWVTPRRHMGENVSDQSLDFLAIIPKSKPASGAHGTSGH
jgi:hypothetical protein